MFFVFKIILYYVKMLKIGTDCSGIEAPIQALLQLNIPFIHVFSSEIDKYCIQSIKANYDPEIIFGDKDGPFPEGDITKRNIKDVPDIDFYVCGFPCQPFSSAGKQIGLKDKRGNVFFSCMEVIEKKQPKYFILENVKNLKSHDGGKTWEIILKSLTSLEKYGYNINWKILNTKDYGIPQNRERIFIVGTKTIFEWPEKKEVGDLKSYIDFSDTSIYESKTVKKYESKINKNSIFINLCFIKYTSFPKSDRICPCLDTRSSIYCIPMSRYANMKEKLKLQGFDTNFKQVVSDTQMKKQIGNSMSVNVLKCIIGEIL